MRILAPIDGSDTSSRALSFAAEMADRYDADIDVVHITDTRNEATEEILRRAREVLEDSPIDAEPRIATDLDLDFRPSNKVGEDILDLVEARDYDHVVMGHHGQGVVERAILGSAAETVVRSARVSVTVVP